MKRVVIGHVGLASLACLLVTFVVGCAVEQTTHEEDNDPSAGGVQRVGLDKNGEEQPAITGPWKDRPIQKHQADPTKGRLGGGPVPDPWKSILGPVPDPWQPSDPPSSGGGSGAGGGSNEP